MKSKIILILLLSASLIACAQKTPQVKHRNGKKARKSEVSKTKFTNAADPICEMKTENDMKDTAVYKGKTYGFCSAYCRDEFKKNPGKYVEE